MIITTKTAYKYRLYPSRSQISLLENQFSMCRHLYNWSLAERKEAFETEGTSIGYCQQCYGLVDLKKERPWFKSVYSQVLQHTLKRLDDAYQNFFRRVEAGETPGYPKFKKRGQWHSITYPQYHKSPESLLQVPKIGKVKLVLHRKIPDNAKVKTLTITHEGGKWFACFSAELSVSIEPKQDLLRPVGIDMGLIDFIYTSDGANIPAPKYLRKKENQLKKLQRRIAKTEKRSKAYLRLLKILRKCHYRVKCQRNEFLHKLSNLLLSRYDILCHEDLSISNMIRRPKPKQDENTGAYLPNGASAKSGLNKSISDVGWGRFFEFLRYKAEILCKQIVPVAPHYTSQICSTCGQIVKKSLSTRTHRCDCGYVANRDHNASLNILRIGMDALFAANIPKAAQKPLLNL